jgi:hypothetical protein
MPVSYSIDPAARLVRLHYDGSPTYREAVLLILGILSDADFRPGFDILADRRGIPAPTPQYVRSLIEFAKRHHLLGESRFALVVDSPASFGMARMGQHIGDGLPTPIMIFEDLAEAEAWLGGGGRAETERASKSGEDARNPRPFADEANG